MISHSRRASDFAFGVAVEGSLRYASSAFTLAFWASGKSSHDGSRLLYSACVFACPSHWLLSRSSSSSGVACAARTDSSTEKVLYTYDVTEMREFVSVWTEREWWYMVAW